MPMSESFLFLFFLFIFCITTPTAQRWLVLFIYLFFYASRPNRLASTVHVLPVAKFRFGLSKSLRIIFAMPMTSSMMPDRIHTYGECFDSRVQRLTSDSFQRVHRRVGEAQLCVPCFLSLSCTTIIDYNLKCYLLKTTSCTTYFTYI
jgi:hypothetical protein